MLRRTYLLVGALFAAWLVIALALFVLPRGGSPEHADAVVVLAGSKTRLPVGLRLMREGYAPLLLVSRGHMTPQEDRVCAGRTRFAVVCFDAKPFSTSGEARTIARIARERHLQRIDVVTSGYHDFRAGVVIRRCYHGGVRMIAAPQEWWKAPWFMITESGKLLVQLTVERGC